MVWPCCGMLVMTCMVIVNIVVDNMVITAEVDHRDNERTSASCCMLHMSL